MNSHCGDKIILKPPYFLSGISRTDKITIFVETDPIWWTGEWVMKLDELLYVGLHCNVWCVMKALGREIDLPNMTPGLLVARLLFLIQTGQLLSISPLGDEIRCITTHIYGVIVMCDVWWKPG